ncbi:MAG: hypothetical protein JSV19_03390 [Phycisphaerales bacterium]|nr:MAG: hypothetical protein JSV19_03390 [Phycisphaerales bacterium]
MNGGERKAAGVRWLLLPALLFCRPTNAEWAVTELPTPGGVESTQAWAVNDSGVVCGAGPDADGVQTVFRYDGGMTLLPHLVGTNGAHSVARDINSSGVIVGFSYNAAGRERAVYWTGTAIAEIPLPAGVNPDRSSRVEAINDAGIMVGHYFDDAWSAKPFYYEGQVHDLAPALAAAGLSGHSYAKGINNNGLICGHARGAVYRFWTYDIATGICTDLGTIDPFLACTAAAVNDAGHVVGRGMSSSTSPYHALLHDGAFQIIDATVTDTQWAWNINNAGRVIGTARPSGGPEWSWYSDGPGDGSIMPIDLPGVTELEIKGINDHNVIVGYGLTATSGEYTRAFVIAPPPGDADHDGDIDLDDYAAFAVCVSGPAGGAGFVPPSAACLAAFDFDPADADVDLADFAAFERAFEGV